MKKTVLKRIISMLLIVLLMVGLLPMKSNGIVALASSNTYVFDSEVELASLEKNAIITSGTIYENGYFETFGETKRANSNTYAIEVSQEAKSGIVFAVSGSAIVKVTASSTGSANTSVVGLVDEAGNLIIEGNNAMTVSGTTSTELNYSISEGIYKVVSPTNADYKRGARILKIEVEQMGGGATETVYEFVASSELASVEQNKGIEAGTAYTDGYFTTFGNTKRANSSTHAIEVSQAAESGLEFTVTGTAALEMEVSSTGGSNTSAVGIMDSTNTVIKEKNNTTLVTGTGKTVLYYDSLTAGTYKIVSPEDSSNKRGARIYTVKVTETAGEITRKPWMDVEDPIITDIIQKDGNVTVSLVMPTGSDGADSITVFAYDEDEKVLESKTIGKNSNSLRSVDFTFKNSGDYKFSVEANRESEIAKVSAISSAFFFLLPLQIPVIKSATNIGNGSVRVSWNEVKEAEIYVVYYKQTKEADFKTAGSVEELSLEIHGLIIGEEYTFAVKALRNEEESELDTINETITLEMQREWIFSAFGDGVNKTDNYFSGNANLGSVTVASVNGKGKLVPASKDGLAFYYTRIDPEKENFILRAKVTVDNWTLSNGQEGFGLMAADTVGENGDSSTFWNNSYMASATKVEYFWDRENNKVSDAGDKISMKLGIGAQEKIGAIGENTDVANFKSSMYSLDTTFGSYGAGEYNIVGNYTKAPQEVVYESELVTTLDLSIQRDNTGYRLSYTDEQGKTTTKLFYDIDRTALTQIDKDNIYVGFFASRNAKITVTDIQLTISNPETDPPAEEVETTYVTPSYRVISTNATGNMNYELVYLGNADGVLTIKDSKGNIIVNKEAVSANTYFKKNIRLAKGNNTYTITFTPNKDYKPGEHQKLSNYDTVTFTHTITNKNYDRKSIYVSPTGKASGDGSKSKPLDIYTAVKYVTPGQKIVLAGGVYSMNTPLTIARGIDGTKDAMIYMIADSEATTRPVLDFNKTVTGIVFAGDYWYIQGFDVTNSANGQKGLQLSGSYCTLDKVNAYNNGNTGIQISRYLSTDTFEDWPSYNLVLNCTSYANADRGYEDADGFAAKLTIGEGNVFDGCIAYNNADDGWDLFAKIETGPIGIVTIKNSVAFGNGYLPDGTNAGNGNGFKMGGSSITGAHQLINSIAYNNKAKGIDSNSGPDIQIYNSTTFNNESYNVALYTNDAKNTDFLADGIVSFKTNYTEINENFKLLGSQDSSKVYGLTNYYWNNGKSINTNNVEVTNDWFVSLDTTTNITRNADGTINMNGLLELTEVASVDAGARMTGSPSKVIVIEDEIETPKPTYTPTTPTSTPTPTIKPEETIKIEVPVDAKGNVDWTKVNHTITEKLDAFNKLENASKLTLSIELVMGNNTKLSKELLKTIEGENVDLTFILNDGVQWTINGKDVIENQYKDVDLGVTLNTTSVPKDVIIKLLGAKGQADANQISLAHNGDFGFKAELTLDLNKLQKSSSIITDISKLVAGIYYYDAKTGNLTLQSASKIGKNGEVTFTFTHASEYVVSVSDKLVIDDEAYAGITVNGVITDKLAKRWRYVGGTTGNKEKLEIVLPAGLQDAVDKELISLKASYITSNKEVAIVSKNGVITAVAPGVATVKTKLTIGDKEYVYATRVTVKKAFIKFVKSTKNIGIGEKSTFEVAVYGYNVKDITWLTSKKNIAIVYKNQGKLRAVVTGKTIGTENVCVRVLDSKGNYVYGSAPVTVVKTK